MKTWKKLLLGFAGIFALTTLAACSSSKDTLEKVQDKGTLTVALNPHFAPFEFKTIQNGKDTIVGADVEIAKAIADELGVKVKFSEMSFDNVLANVQSGKADIAIPEYQPLKNVRKSLISQILTMSLKRFLLSKKMRQELTNKQVILLKNL